MTLVTAAVRVAADLAPRDAMTVAGPFPGETSPQIVKEPAGAPSHLPTDIKPPGGLWQRLGANFNSLLQVRSVLRKIQMVQIVRIGRIGRIGRVFF